MRYLYSFDLTYFDLLIHFPSSFFSQKKIIKIIKIITASTKKIIPIIGPIGFFLFTWDLINNTEFVKRKEDENSFESVNADEDEKI